MSRRTYRTLERPTGTGEVWDGGEYLATVQYALVVQCEVVVVMESESHLPQWRHETVSGEIVVLEGELNELSGPFDLHLADGRCLTFFTGEGFGEPLLYEIITNGGFHAG